MKRKISPVSSQKHGHLRKKSTTAMVSAAAGDGPSMPTLELTPKEQQLKALLLDVAAFADAAPDRAGAEPLVLRWAGGWVRDRLLGIESHDIDTAINLMTGYPFAERMTQFCDVPANRERHGVGEADIGSLHKIARNPEKSKNLETTTVRIFGYDVDFVNLRTEVYHADSRNPEMDFGTAEEDALRRDATVNALFFNLHTGAVEDLTGSGVRDMRDRIMRTPLEPFQTFMDDPLRVLRLVRFASRLQFSIDPAAEQMMGDARVLDALRLKISRERVGEEVDKMLKGKHTNLSPPLTPPQPSNTDIKGKHPRDALRFIDQLGLYHAIFTDPARSDMARPDLTNWSRVYECLHRLADTQTPGSIYDVLVHTEEAAYFAWSLAALAPWEQVHDPEPTKQGAKVPLPLITLAAREGVKATNKLCDVVTGAHRHRAEIAELKRLVCEGDQARNERDRFGMAIREWDTKGGHWRLQVLFALFVDVMTRGGVEGRAEGGGRAEQEQEQRRDDVLREWQEFLDHLEMIDVMDAPQLKRLIDGRQLSAALGIKPGKWMAAAMDVCVAWQFRNPDEEDPAGAVEEVRLRAEELGIGKQLKK